MNASILLLEDDSSLGLTLEERLRSDGYQVERVTDVCSARLVLMKARFDLWLFDVGLPDGTGFDLVKEFRAKGIGTPVVFLTARTDAEARLHGYEIGAEEYIPKPFLYKEVNLRLKHVLSTHAPKELSVTRVQEYEIDWKAFWVLNLKNGQKTAVTPRDMAVLRSLVIASPKVMSRDEILNDVVGIDESPSHRTIDNSIVRLRQIFVDETRAWIKSVRGIGYQWQVGPIEKVNF